MTVRKFYTKKKKPQSKFERETGRWYTWGYDIWLNGRGSKHVRDPGFASKADAEAAVARLRLAQKDRQYLFARKPDIPTLAAITKQHLLRITKRREHTRSNRVLTGWLSMLPSDITPLDLRSSHIDIYVNARRADGLSDSSIDRELNIISSCLRNADRHYEQLRQWTPPRINRPRFSHKPRKRVVYLEERRKLIAYLIAPQREGEQPQEAKARYRVGRKVQFAFLVGCRHSEMLGIKKSDVDSERRSVRIVGTKTDRDRVIDPLPSTAFAILQEAAAESRTPYVFGSPNIRATFYRILQSACEAVGILYGRSVPGGMVLHDARHTVTSLMGAEGVEPATIQEQLGWSDKEFLLYYSHSTPAGKQRSADIMEQMSGSGIQGVNKNEEPDELSGTH